MKFFQRFKNADLMKKIGVVGLLLTFLGTVACYGSLALSYFNSNPSVPRNPPTTNSESGVAKQTRRIPSSTGIEDGHPSSSALNDNHSGNTNSGNTNSGFNIDGPVIVSNGSGEQVIGNGSSITHN